MSKEILIGRSVPDGNYTVPPQEVMVSRLHAKIIVGDDSIVFEDLGSANGTYVNGLRVNRKVLNTDDTIVLGGPQGYAVRVSDLLNCGTSVPDAPSPSMSDAEYSRRVAGLENVYNEFQTKQAQLQTQGQSRMMMRRMGPTMLVGAITTVASVLVPEALRVIVAVSGSVMTVVVFLIANKWASKATLEITNEKQALVEMFELDYVCPDCKCSWKGRSYKLLRKQGCCPSCKRRF